MANNSFPYPRTDECNPRMSTLDGMNTDYSGKEARLALAIADSLQQEGCCNGGSGGGSNLPDGDYFEFSTTVGTSNIELLPANVTRTLFVLHNLSTAHMYIRFGNVASEGVGHLICPNTLLYGQIPQQIVQSINIIASEADSEIFGWYLQ